MDISDLVKLTSKAWTIPILGSFGAGVPGRQAPLLDATGASRTAFGQSMQHLQALELVERNPGHGHPLRPEYRITARGEVLCGPALSVIEAVEDSPHATLVRRMWVLPLLAVSQDARPFGALASSLAPITDRALSHALRQVQDAGWMAREVDIASRPPRATYQAQDIGALIGDAARRMLETRLPPGADGARPDDETRPRPRPTLG